MTADFINLVIRDIDNFIKNENSPDISDLTCDLTETERLKGSVTPIYSTFSDGVLVFLIKIAPNNGNIGYVNVSTDEGVIVGRSEIKNNLNDLLFESDEGWTKF